MVHHDWTPAAFLEECEEVSFINVGGVLRAKVYTKVAPHDYSHLLNVQSNYSL